MDFLDIVKAAFFYFGKLGMCCMSNFQLNLLDIKSFANENQGSSITSLVSPVD